MAYPTIAPSDVFITQVRTMDRFLEVDWDDGTASRFHYVWLRDNCYCDDCHDPSTHQKMVWLVDIPEEIAPLDMAFTERSISIDWNHLAHKSRFDTQWLRAHCYSERARHARKFTPSTWNAAAAGDISDLDYRSVTQNEVTEIEMLERVRDHGFVLLRNVPVDPAETERIGRRFGYPRETNWGVVLDIVAEPDPVNIANTGVPIAPHTDDSFRYGMPGIDMFHCLQADQSEGGQSLLVDGFHVAQVL